MFSMSHYWRLLRVHMENSAFVLVLLVLWISGTLALPLISEEDGPGELCDYNEPESNCAHDWEENNENIVRESDKGENKNVNTNCNTNVDTSGTEYEPDEYFIETRDYINKDQNEEPLDKELFSAPEELEGPSLFYQTVYDDLEPSVLVEETMSQTMKKSKVKRSSLFDNLQEQGDETTDASVESKTVSGNNIQETSPSTSSQNTPPKAETTPKPWFWSWLFKSSRQSTNNSNVMENSSQMKSPETAEETIKNIDCESGFGKEQNSTGESCGNNLTFGKGNSDNFTTQIRKEEAILEQQIMDHNPGITTTDSVWNTDEFVDKTSK